MTGYTVKVEKRDQFVKELLSFCQSEMGKKETTGNNDGEHIRNYMRCVKLAYGKKYPYCAAGLAWCMQKACQRLNIKYPFPKYHAAANYYYSKASEKGEKFDAKEFKAGDLVVWRKPNGQGHIAICSKDGSIEESLNTFEFNTSNGLKGSQREGNGNYPRIRSNYKNLSKSLKLRGIVRFV